MLTPWRMKVYPRAFALAVAIAWIVLVAISARTKMTPQGIPLGADYVVFYAAGTLVRTNPEALFDPGALADAQAAAIGRTELEGYHAWVYPTFVAALYAPLALLPYVVSYVVYTLLLVGLVWFASGRLAALAPSLAPWRETVFLATLVFYPLLRATAGGQNTALTLLLYAAIGSALVRSSDRDAGLLLGALAYKPHFAVLTALFVALLGRWRALVWALPVCALWYAIGAMVAGWAWPVEWWDSVARYRVLEADTNGPLLVSFLGVAERIFGAGSSAALAIGGALSLAVLALVAVRARTDSLPGIWAIGAAAIVLASPHTQFYDLGLLAVVGAVAIDRLGSRIAGPVAVLWIASCAHALFHDPVVQPTFIVALGALVVALRIPRDAPL
jgi:alpha-1,2-mannosyltransferase